MSTWFVPLEDRRKVMDIFVDEDAEVNSGLMVPHDGNPSVHLPSGLDPFHPPHATWGELGRGFGPVERLALYPRWRHHYAVLLSHAW